MKYRKLIKTNSEEEANKLLGIGWELIDCKIEKLKVPAGKVCIGKTFGGDWLNGAYSTPRYEIQYEEVLECIYILGEPI
jgi:hypothetical protein